MIQQLLSLCILLTLWVAISDGASVPVRRPRASSSATERGRRRPREMSVIRGIPSICPKMRCVGVEPTCRFKEVIIFRFEFGRRKNTWLECLGCPYCIDIPADYLDRFKRSAPEVETIEVADVEDMNEVLPANFRTRRAARRMNLKSQLELCKRVTCPVSPPDKSCLNPGVLEGYLRERPCISCPTCLHTN